jgi:hypothetical protein
MSDGLNAWPAGLLTRVRKLEKIYKTTVKLQPVNQGSVTAGNKILLQFPMDSVFDLKSLSFDALYKLVKMVINLELLQIITHKLIIYLVMG